MLSAVAAAIAVLIVWAPATLPGDASGWRRDAAIASDATNAYGNGHTKPTAPPASVGPASATPTSSAPHHSNGLPFTGGDVLGLTFIGIGLVLMGTAIPGPPRRRRRARGL